MYYPTYREALVAVLAEQTRLPHGRCWAAVNDAVVAGLLGEVHNETDLEAATAAVRALLERDRPPLPTPLGSPALTYTPPVPFSQVPRKERLPISGSDRAWARDLRAGLGDASLQVRARCASRAANRDLLHEVTAVEGLMVAQAIASYSSDPAQLHAAAVVADEYLAVHHVHHLVAATLVWNDHTAPETLELLAARFLDPAAPFKFDRTMLIICCDGIPEHPNCRPDLAAALRAAMGDDHVPNVRHRFHPMPWRPPTREEVAQAGAAAWAALAGSDLQARADAAGDESTPPEALAQLAGDRNTRVRARLAYNEAAPADVLALLAGDEATLVQKGLARNGAAPPGAVRSARLGRRSQWGRLIDLAEWAAGQRLDEEWQEAVVATGPS